MKKSVKYKNVNYRNIDNNSALHKKKDLLKTCTIMISFYQNVILIHT